MSLYSMIRKDRHVRKLRTMLRSGSYNLNTVEWIRELEAMHAARLIRNIPASDVVQKFQTRFMRAVLQNQSNRSRAVEIRMRCFRVQSRLTRHLDRLAKLLLARYSEQLNRTLSTKAERDNLVRSAFSRADDLLQEITTTMQLADMFIADIDAASWTVKHIIDAMQLIQEKGKQF